MGEPTWQVPEWPRAFRDAWPPSLDKAWLARLTEGDGQADESGLWPEPLWRSLIEVKAPRWLLPAEFGGDGCDRPTLCARYARIAEGSLTAAFILTQYDAAVRRLVSGYATNGSEPIRNRLNRIARGESFVTVGISHLTTSRRHGERAMAARADSSGGFELEGVMPWVTAAPRAEAIVTGATLDDGRQILVVVPTDRPGLTVRPPFPIAALQASCTSEVVCERVTVEPGEILAGPSREVMTTPGQVGTGGLETSALALGLSRAALVALANASENREDLLEPAEALFANWTELSLDFLAAAEGRSEALSSGEIRSRANTLALRTTQAYLTARKGSGFLMSEPAQRWARQALFFLVWSCPAPVAQTALRDLAGLCSG